MTAGIVRDSPVRVTDEGIGGNIEVENRERGRGKGEGGRVVN
jgi:hypothetical protein